MRYPQNVKEFIQENYKGITSMELTERLNKACGTNYRLKQIRMYMGHHGLCNGINTRYKKGNVPYVKGKSPKEYMSPEGYKSFVKSLKGKRSWKWKPEGSVYVDSRGYPQVKTENGWRCVKNVLWEKHNGEIPKDSIVTMLDGDKTNVTIDNLALIKKSTSLKLSHDGLRFNDKDLTKVGISIIQLKEEIYKYEK